MSTKASALKRAASAFKKAMAPQRYGVHGRSFTCQICGHDRFHVGSEAFSRLRYLACAECGHVEFFAATPPILDENVA
jgi:transcription elongation factor Elf1